MLVFGDHSREIPPGSLLDDLRRRAAALASDQAASDDAVRNLLIESGELTQGLLDDEHQRLGCDELTPLSRRCGELTLAAARLIGCDRAFWRQSTRALTIAIDRFAGWSLPKMIRVKAPEGFLFYAVYPELYYRAAQELIRSGVSVRTVIGIRSIGASLAAAVASALPAAKPLITLRPVGHPFERELRIGPRLERRILSAAGSAEIFAVVDEGPGISGSSFAAVAKWLGERGVDRSQIHFFPSHAGDLGSQARPDVRAHWHQSKRHVIEFDQTQKDLPAMIAWISGDERKSLTEARDISGGAWRREHFENERDWPPAHVQLERRKFIFRTGDQTWLAKYIGLGHYGEELFERARLLARSGLIPSPRSLRRGFLVHPWLPSARPNWPAPATARGEILERVADYLGVLVANFPAPTRSGATPGELLAMAEHNVTQSLGAEWARILCRWEEALSQIAAGWRPVMTDNRMHAWEWLVSDGRIWKADALDHHRGHDLIGSQDLAWDIAGAAIELDLSDRELEELVRKLRNKAGYCLREDQYRFCTHCYLAFQIGYYALAADSARSSRLDESKRLATAALRYRKQLRARLEQDLN